MIKKFIENEYEYARSSDYLIFECEKCGNDFKKQKKFLKSILNGTSKSVINFCSRKCEVEARIIDVKINCSECNLIFKTKPHLMRKSKSGNMFCSKPCSAKYNNKKREKKVNVSEYESYKQKSNFDFSLDNFQNEFDFSLIIKYGWYSPTNKKNNLNGVSRDHMLSIKEGFKMGIDPYIIKHPANCRLMKQTENSSKNSKSTITLEELLKRIKFFEEKYGIIV